VRDSFASLLCLRVGVLMVDVRKVRMSVPQPLMTVLVNVGLPAVPIPFVLVLVMRIVRVGVAMNQQLMYVVVFVVLGQM
jgi:hypothetical protein